MINLRDYFLNNSIKVGRIHYVPKRYLAGMISLHIGEKASSIFKVFKDVFKTNAQYREGFDAFVEEAFVLGPVHKVESLKDEKFQGMTLNEDYPFTSSINNGFRLIKEFLGVDSVTDFSEEISYRLMHVRYHEFAEFLRTKEKVVNCGIDQNMFDFVIARECLANQETKKPEEIESLFFSLLINSELLGLVFDNIKGANEHRCLSTLRSLSLSSYDPRFEIVSLEVLRELSIDELFYHFGTNINIYVNVLNYYSDDADTVVPQLFKNYISSIDPFYYEVLRRREKETLEEIGQSHNVTRERIRQVEAVEIDKFNDFYYENLCSDSKNLIFVFPYISRIFPLSLYKDTLGDYYDAFRNIFKSLKYVGESKYVKELDAVVESENVLSQFKRIVDEVLGDYFKKVDLDEKVRTCLESLEDYGFNADTIKYYISSAYKDKDTAYVKHGVRLSRAFQVETILESHFDEGFHFSDEEQIKELNKYAYEEFGDIIFSEEEIATPTKHTIQAILERSNVRLVARGTYIHKSKAHDLPMELVEKISTYLNEKNRPVAYSNLFETFQPELEKLGITNKYALQGAMSIYEGALFKGKRDYVMPVEIKQTLRENMNAWIKSRQELFTYNDFEKEFKGVAWSVFISALYEAGGTAYYWQQGYINVNSLNISEEDKNKLRQLVSFLIGQYHNEYCSADEIFNLVNIQMHEFITGHGMKYSYDLFSVLQVLFADEFKFQRPLIGSMNAVFETKYEILDGYLATKNIVNLTKLRKFIDSKIANKTTNYYTIYDIIIDKWNEFVPIDVDTIVSKESLSISDKELTRLDVIIEMLLEEKDTLNIEEDIVNKFIFKELAGIQTNRYLVFGLVNTYFHDKYSVYEEAKHYRGGTFYIKAK